MTDVKLITLDPGHFHAALVQKTMYPQVAPRVHVYAPLGADLTAHLNRIAGFNGREHEPTTWELDIHANNNYLQRLLAEKPGNVVVLSGRNRAKIDYLLAAVENGLHVLADKPWILTVSNLPKLQRVLDIAGRNGLIAYDIMTERYEITSILQREFVNDAGVFGRVASGSADHPAVSMESVHYLLKKVAGVPLQRPPWFFDVKEQGEALTDVGTHLVDLVAWILFPNQAIDSQSDIEMIAGKRWPTMISKDNFRRITGKAEFPDYLSDAIKASDLEYFCNNSVSYKICGHYVKLDILWDFEAAPGAGDKHFAAVRGTKSRVEIRQGPEQNFRPELFVVPEIDESASVRAALTNRIEQLEEKYPGIELQELPEEWRIGIPERYRIGHEAHFGEVTSQFLHYLNRPDELPDWEKPCMMAKYYVTTHGVSMAQ